jgi:hypothetical protein
VRAVGFLPGGKELASASADGTVLVWEFEKVVKGRGD